MKKLLPFGEIHKLIRKLPVPSATMPITPSMAGGYKLAQPVQVKGVIPERPVSLVDGLAVRTQDVLVGIAGKHRETENQSSRGTNGGYGGLELTTFAEVGYGLQPAPEQEAEEPTSSSNSVSLRIREAPKTAKKADSLEPGEAIPVPVGGEVPRGAQFIYPLAWIAGEPQDLQAGGSVERSESAQSAQNGASPNGPNGNPEDEADKLPFADPGRGWDLLQKYSEGWVELDRLDAPLPQTHIQIGDWARNRDPLLPEGIVLRAGELALLNAADVEEVVVHRRPVVGIASLAVPFPQAQREAPRSKQHCPLTELTVNLAKSSLVSAFPFGPAPGEFDKLLKSVQHWLGQVDFLVLVGGSHHGPNCAGLDVLKALGEVQVEGADICPGGDASFGTVGQKTMAVLPGSFADVLVAYVLLVRPLTHHSLAPPNFADSVMLDLERGEELTQDRTMVYPVQVGYNREKASYTTNFDGRLGDEWLDYSRGHALLVAEAGRQFSNGEVVEAFLY